MNKATLSLPVVETSPVSPVWEGLTPAFAPPEPDAPQGVYAEAVGETEVEATPTESVGGPVELLAPAGGPEAAYAGLHYGADAVYLGLKKFSARAEAENFSPDELAQVVAYAHRLSPRRRVFLAVNTLVRQDELGEMVAALGAAVDAGVDALIVQDLGVRRLAKRYFPELELHGSTQLAVHNKAGAEALRDLGFSRVVLARELTLEEVRDVTSASGVETEVFIHGALCYAYSGLCLFSSQTLGRSGNRGKCSYSCRDGFTTEGAPDQLRDGGPVRRDPKRGFPFSMKDLALPDHLPALRAAGVSCFKVEGRKKSPLYVASVTDYYRRLLDGKLRPGERPALEADLQTVFSRPWTNLFVRSHRDKEVADRDTVGHRGALVGKVESVRRRGPQDVRLRFRTARALERHDGLQVDLPTQGKPFGFPIDHLYLADGQEVVEAAAGAEVEVGLPAEYPVVPPGAPVYCSSSQAVKRHYRTTPPREDDARPTTAVSISATLADEALTAVGRCGEVEVSRSIAGPFAAAKDLAAVGEAARTAFGKLGGTHLTLAEFRWSNPAGGFAPVSRLNQLRRDLAVGMEQALREHAAARVARVTAEVCAPTPAVESPRGFRWSIKVDRVGFVDEFVGEDWNEVDELVVDITRDHPAILAERLEHWGTVLDRSRIRLALPALTRKWEERGLLQKVERLWAAGWRRWEAANVSAWSYLGGLPDAAASLDLATDWSVYVLNREAGRQLLDQGVRRFALSPEDGLTNMRPLLAEFGAQAVVIVYQDTPLFLAESCAYANLIGGCPGKANCTFESMEMVSDHGERVTALDYHCRTIVLNRGAFCLAPRLRELADAGARSLRADFLYRKYEATQVRDLWRKVRAGRVVAGGHAANFDRGVL